MEIFLTSMYAVLIGLYQVFKKLAKKKSTETTIIVIFTTIAFLMSLIWIPLGVAIPWKFVPIFAFKGFIIVLCWFIFLKVLNTVDLSIATITTILSAVLSFILGMVIFKESTGIMQIIGSIMIVGGVTLINIGNNNSKGKINIWQILLLIIYSLICTASNVIDKFTTTHLTAYQTQFWFLLFATIFAWIFFGIECVKSKKIIMTKSDIFNIWSIVAGIFLFVGDAMLFHAYKVPGSKMITITILLNLKSIVTILVGLAIFKEKNIMKKIILSILVVIGAIFISIF